MGPLEDGRTRLIPANWDKTYFDWMRNIQDWCISRQIWWGHRIPAWTCANCGLSNRQPGGPGRLSRLRRRRPGPGHRRPGHLVLFGPVALLHPGLARSENPGAQALLPHVRAGDRLRHPVFLGGADDDDGDSLHGRRPVPGGSTSTPLVRDRTGQKMSKSKGNVMDPLEVMDTYGTDAFRFTLAALAAQGRDIRMSEERVEGYRNFANKIWNASRFTFMNLEGSIRAPSPWG